MGDEERKKERIGMPHPAGPGEADPPWSDRERRSGPLESLFQEAVRRAASVGFSSFFMTEEAVRRALSEAVPKEWSDFITQQSDEVRQQALDSLVQQFGAWLRTVDLAEVLKAVLEDYEFSATIDISAHRRDSESAASLKVVRRPK